MQLRLNLDMPRTLKITAVSSASMSMVTLRMFTIPAIGHALTGMTPMRIVGASTTGHFDNTAIVMICVSTYLFVFLVVPFLAALSSLQCRSVGIFAAIASLSHRGCRIAAAAAAVVAAADDADDAHFLFVLFISLFLHRF